MTIEKIKKGEIIYIKKSNLINYSKKKKKNLDLIRRENKTKDCPRNLKGQHQNQEGKRKEKKDNQCQTCDTLTTRVAQNLWGCCSGSWCLTT
jgi:hypothetical protein